MTSRRPAFAILAAAALSPPLVWLLPAAIGRRAPSFRDQGDFFYPLKLYTSDRLARGELPLWNPLSGTGEPWLANLQSGVFYPPAALFLISSPAIAAALYLGLHFAIAAWGSWSLAKREGGSDAAALAASTIFVACGFTASLSAYWNHLGAFAYLPAIASLARSGLTTRRERISLAALLGLQAMAGSPEVSAGTILLVLLLAAPSGTRLPQGWAQAPRSKAISRAAVATVVGLLLAAWCLVPFGELAIRSGRGAPVAPSERDYGAIGLRGLASIAGLTDARWDTAYLSSLMIGPAALFCAAAAYRDRQRRRLVLLLAGVAAAGVLVSLEWPPATWLRAIPPLDRVRYPAKAFGAAVFALSALAALGSDGLRFDPPRRRERLPLLALGLALLVAAAISGLSPAVRAAGAGALGAFMLLVLFGSSWGPGARAIVQGAGTLAMLGSLVLAGRGLFQFVPESEIRRVPDSVRPLSRVAGRVLTPPPRDLYPWVLGGLDFPAATLRRQREALMGYTNLLFATPTVRTAAALPTAQAARTGATVDGSDDPLRAAAAAGARVLWTPFRPARLPSRKRDAFYEVPIDRHQPRLSFVSEYRVEADPVRAWEAASSGRVDFAREVLLDRTPPMPRSQASRRFLVARITEERPESVTVDATVATAGLLVLADLWYPGWVAQTDGRPAPILVANGMFRAVPLAAGTHRVLFRYRPLSFYVGAAVSGAAWITLLLLSISGEPARRESLL